jgi:hypothetical protein
MQNEDKQKSVSEENSSTWRHRLFDVAVENFPYPILLATTDVGQVLPLVPHPHQPALQVVHLGQVAGNIALDDHQDLLDRVRIGERFEGVISENYGGCCRVLVRPANSE